MKGKPMRSGFEFLVMWGLMFSSLVGCAPGPALEFDVVIFGGTSGGVAAAVQAARMGKTAAIIEPSRHLGGLSSGGLGKTDTGRTTAIGGIAREFYERLGRHYGKTVEWQFEPHVAEETFNAMTRESGTAVYLGDHLKGLNKQGGRIVEIRTAKKEVFRAKMFIDASYEGDLMAAAGVSYTMGRESNATYDETLNGVHYSQRHHQFDVAVDPYVVEGDPTSGLLPGVHGDDPGQEGQGDHRVQAYCLRMCMTKDKENQIPFGKPPGYDPQRYELLARYLRNAEAAGKVVKILAPGPVQGGKTDTNNNGGFSTDNIGMNYDYPEANPARRAEIFQEHLTYQQGLMWFLCHDPRVPKRYREDVSQWGLCKDEFQETGGWPHQLYIREARRMVSDVVMTQHHCQWRAKAEHPVGLASYGMDSHNVQRFVKDGRALNEGDVQVGVQGPFPIAYEAIVPSAGECSNLFVPVCLSSSHIAYGSIRMEPVFMVLGQSAATAACQAIDQGVPVQEIDMAGLHRRLLADQQVLAWSGPARAMPIDPKTLEGMVIDDRHAELVGPWNHSTSVPGYIGEGYLHDSNVEQGNMRARFKVKVIKGGRYRVRFYYTPNANRATNAHVEIQHAEGKVERKVNERIAGKGPAVFSDLGVFSFQPGDPSYVEVSNAGADGHVVVDAVQLLPAE
jgi:hypothetical protein